MLTNRTLSNLDRAATIAHPRNAGFGLNQRVSNVGMSELRIKL